jgi:hypothetical protein
MSSKTIGNSTPANNTAGATADYTSFDTWHAAETGSSADATIITQFSDIQNSQFDASASAGTYLVTADSTCAWNAPTAARGAACARTRMPTGIDHGACVNITGTGWTFEKMSFVNPGSNAETAVTPNAPATIRRCFMNTSRGVLSGDFVGTAYVTNCASTRAYGVTTFGSGTMKAYHCTSSFAGRGFWNIGYGFGGPLSVYGCIANGGGSSNEGFNDFSNGWGDSNWNVSIDNSAPGTTHIRNAVGVLTDITPGSENFALSGAVAVNIVDRSAFDVAPNADTDTDPFGTTRPETAADAGVYQHPPSAPDISMPTPRNLVIGTSPTFTWDNAGDPVDAGGWSELAGADALADIGGVLDADSGDITFPGNVSNAPGTYVITFRAHNGVGDSDFEVTFIVSTGVVPQIAYYYRRMRG